MNDSLTRVPPPLPVKHFLLLVATIRVLQIFSLQQSLNFVQQQQVKKKLYRSS